ncbi:MAG: DMT family transporter [Reinekea sp.]|nr:DMT family transporter [Reinekea sp.]
MKIVILGFLTAIAFALNSILGRAALAGQWIDPYLFTVIRLCSAAAVLSVVLWVQKRPEQIVKFRWKTTLFLLLYAFAFSIAYAYVSSATGALILFATVQFIMIGYGLYQGQRLSIPEWSGIVLAIVGFLVLVLPGVNQPPLLGFTLMVIAGVGWALFSIAGLASSDAILDVSQSFVSAVPISLTIALLFAGVGEPNVTVIGAILALLSGVFASGLGYCIWYLMLPLITSVSAAVFQLLVPVLVALMGVLLLGESFSTRFYIASVMVLIGLGGYVWARHRRTKQ